MARLGCPSCGRNVAAGWLLSVTPWRMYRQWRPDSQRKPWDVALCVACAEWLGGLVAVARGERAAEPVFGAPASGTRKLVFDDQCHVCFELPHGRAARVTWIDPSGRRLEMFACDACEAWLFSLATDGNTLRGFGDRQIDGPYGYWPHPNLRGVTVQFDISNRNTLDVARQTAMAMGMIETSGGAAVRVIEAARTQRARPAAGKAREIVLAGPRARRELLAALEAGAVAWSTIPATPQQLTACFAAAAREHQPAGWDPETCLSVRLPQEAQGAVILCHPATGAEPWDVAWLLRRFCRGYDELACINGQILLAPRAEPALIEHVAARLRPLLAGRAELQIVPPEERPVQKRIDLAG